MQNQRHSQVVNSNLYNQHIPIEKKNFEIMPRLSQTSIGQQRRIQSQIISPSQTPQFELEFKETEIERNARQSLTSRLSTLINRKAPTSLLTESFKLADRSRISRDGCVQLLEDLATACEFKIIRRSHNSLILRRKTPSKFKYGIAGCMCNHFETVYELRFLEEIRQITILTVEGSREDLKNFAHKIRSWLCQRSEIDCTADDIAEMIRKKFNQKLIELKMMMKQAKQSVKDNEDLDGVMELIEKTRIQMVDYIVGSISGDSLVEVNYNSVVQSVIVDDSDLFELFKHFYTEQEAQYQSLRSFIINNNTAKECLDYLRVNSVFHIHSAQHSYAGASVKIDELEDISSFEEQIQHINKVVVAIEKACFEFHEGRIALDSEDNLFSLTIFTSFYSTHPTLLTTMRMLQCYLRTTSSQASTNSKFNWLNASIDCVLGWTLPK